MQSLWLIFQLLFCLFLGFVLARRLPQFIEKVAFKILPYFTYILLIAIAIEFSQTLQRIADPTQILSHALTLAFATSLGAFLCCYALFKFMGYQPMQGKVSAELFMSSLLNISYAFIALAIGYGISELANTFQFALHISTWHLLLVYMLLIGLDLAYSPLDRSWLNWKIMLVPIGCILGSILGAKKYPEKVSNPRGRGLMAAIDLPSGEQRDKIREVLYEDGLIILACGDRAIRFRPHLNVTKEEIQIALDKIENNLSKI